MSSPTTHTISTPNTVLAVLRTLRRSTKTSVVASRDLSRYNEEATLELASATVDQADATRRRSLHTSGLARDCDETASAINRVILDLYNPRIPSSTLSGDASACSNLTLVVCLIC